ncbi:MAG: hypothetical protein IAG13_21915 [Deltaproteobacteria bacterium]|nr:hypothetical protein [Nannocystaceae bacterium]
MEECDDSVVAQHVVIERVDLRVEDVRLHQAFAQVVEHPNSRCATEAAEGLLVQLAPDSRTRIEGQQADALAAVPSVSSKRRVRLYLPLVGSRTIGPVP